MIHYWFELVLLAAVALLLLYASVMMILRSLPSPTPYVPISASLFPHIDGLYARYRPIDEHSVIYDLGCGDGKVVAFFAKRFPHASVIGVEKSLVPYLVARFRTRHMANAKIIHGDFHAVDLQRATHIYLYLFPVLMHGLLEKCMRELPQGAVVTSCDFRFPDTETVEVVRTGRISGFGGTVYTYIF